MTHGVVARPGVAITTAFALGVVPLDAVHRSTIRALLPAGRVRKRTYEQNMARMHNLRSSGGAKNVTSAKYGDALRRFDDWGWISRGQQYVLIRKRQNLLDHALEYTGGKIPPRFIDLQAALDLLSDDTTSPHGSSAHEQELRRRELVAIAELMRSTVGGSNWSGRGSVRLLPRSSIL